MYHKKVYCRYCGASEGVIKHGFGKSGYQRYRCTSCMHTFQTKYIYKVNSFKEKKNVVATERS